ncbi:MAG: hypothetical protein FJX56_03940 [Alphaproteobacteria bacterium]|nr:hypothetical protein [Alphaproteobacteria bacterium]
MKPSTDGSEVSIDFPDKAYMGAFGHNSGFEAKTDPEGVVIKLIRPGEDRRVVGFHIHSYLFADILEEIAAAIAAAPPIDGAHGEPLEHSVEALLKALRHREAPRRRRARSGGLRET